MYDHNWYKCTDIRTKLISLVYQNNFLLHCKGRNLHGRIDRFDLIFGKKFNLVNFTCIKK